MSWCVCDDDTVCKNKNFENNYGHRCIEADNLLNSEQTLCKYRIVKPNNNVMSNEVCLYLFDGKCAHGLCAAHNKSCVRNSGEACGFFMSKDTFKKQEERGMSQTNCSYAKVENKQLICTNPDNDKDYGEICGEIYHTSEKDYICKYHSKFEKSLDDSEQNSVMHPFHYCQGGIECIKAIEASMTPEEFQGYCKGNVMKYIWRFREKNGLEDLKKAQVYLGWMIESKEKQENFNVN